MEKIKQFYTEPIRQEGDRNIQEKVASTASTEKNLKNYRYYSFRGSDSAVKNIGSIEQNNKLRSIIENPNSFSRQELMRSIFENYSGEAYGNYQWLRQVSAWDNSPDKSSLFYRFTNDFPQLGQLSLHPGFVTKLPYFYENIESINPKNKTADEVLDYMNKDLGNVVLYRGMALTKEELEVIKKEGILADINRNENTKKSIDYFEGLYLSTKYKDMINGHITKVNTPSPMISVTAESETAFKVARESRRKSSNIYVFKISIPALDQIHYSEHGIRRPDIIGNLGSEWEKDRESFVFWKINPDEIIEVTQPNFKQ
jgi:hypothetical protein